MTIGIEQVYSPASQIRPRNDDVTCYAVSAVHGMSNMTAATPFAANHETQLFCNYDRIVHRHIQSITFCSVDFTVGLTRVFKVLLVQRKMLVRI